ncbi:MAG TPA: Gfo/Idh/MocA family oxidoreductase [Conexibacter sp.]|nr:Gfo/Idh/MocA family oxidoreductase [Conexibacter sp.]
MSSPARQPLRGLVVGLGVMGSHHLRVLSSLDDVEVVAVVDPDADRRARAQSAHAHVHAHAALDEALAAHALDFVCAAVPVPHLAPTAHAALAAGLHVLVEKPTAPSEQEALELIAVAEERGLLLGAGHVERFNPAVIALKRKLDEGVIGRVHQMHARRLSPFPNRDSMLGVALDLATHDIDVMRFLSGSEVKRVFAETSQHYHEAAEDLLCATLRFDDEATGLLEVNWITPTKVRELTVTGERGTFRVDYLTQDLFLFEHPTQSNEWEALAGMRGGGEGDMVRFALERREPLRVEWEAFLAAVRDGGEAPVSGRDGLAALSTARAIQQAGRTHETVAPSYRAAVRR